MTAFFNKISRFSLVSVVLFSGVFSSVKASENADEPAEKFNASEVILHHVMDDHIWHLWDGHYGTIYLPVIVYSSERGLDIFSSANFYNDHHQVVEYNGYKLEHNHIYLADTNKAVLDLSITKNVAMLLINALILVLVFRAVANGYKRNSGRAPSGVQSFIEPVIVFIRDEVVKPNIGARYEKFLPYM